MNEKYSVLMSLYQKEKPEYLCEAIDSMLNQTILPDEIVIVKDGPLPEALETVLDKYCNANESLFHIVVSEKNLGLGLALNLGLKNCKNDLVARMDTDDISKPDRCEKQLKLFENDPKLSIVGSNIDEFQDDPNQVISIRKVPLTHKEIYNFSKRRSPFNHPTVMYRRCEVLKVGGYRDYLRSEDIDLFGRMLYSGCVAQNIDESLLFYRCNSDAVKRRSSWPSTKGYILVIRSFWKMGHSSFTDYLIGCAAKMSLFLLPHKFQSWIYKSFLRK